MLTPPTDAQLVSRACDGDDRAFAELFRRHADYVAGVVLRLLGRDEALDDLVQETFITASDKLSTLGDGDRFRGWVAQIAVRHTYRRLKRRRRRAALDVWAREAPGARPAGGDVLPPDVVALYTALESLPAKLRVPWVLHRVEGETLPRTAALCEVSLATVKRRIASAERRLERRLHVG